MFKNYGMFTFGYNRTNFNFDQGMRFTRFTNGRTYAAKQVEMFRQDVEDLVSVPITKMMVYAPIGTIAMGYCVTIFIEGRSGLKFPAPPTYISAIYLQCLAIGFTFMALGAWLVFHAGLRAQVAGVQLRTRRIRIPVPTQRQLDHARKLGSAFEETTPYDMVRCPFLMPNLADSPEHSEDSDNGAGEPASVKTGKTNGINGSKGKKGIKKSPEHRKWKAVRAPGRPGVPDWIEKEMDYQEEFPGASASSHGLGAQPEPFEHFELIRQAQKEWWGAESYCRVCLLFGMMHVALGFGYWLVIHCIAELGMLWCAHVLAAAFCCAVWLIFHLDVLPDRGGFIPVEACGPFLSALTLTLMYAGEPTQVTIDIARALSIATIGLQILFTFRLFMLARPTNLIPSRARESSGQENLSGSCEHPSWLPTAFQHVTYLVAPPKSSKAKESNEPRDPMENVDMRSWYAVRLLLIGVIAMWILLLIGRVVECVMGERMLVTNPGQPPWTRVGQWDGWESGPITSKHYAHVTPMRGHFMWKMGQGPIGYQELWPSDLFGFAAEADAHWAEGTTGDGAAVHDLDRHPLDLIPHPPPREKHGERRLSMEQQRSLRSSSGLLSTLNAVSRPSVPVAVQWPSLLEPELLACGPASAGGQVAALTKHGYGAVVSADAAAGNTAGLAAPFALEGLPVSAGPARGATWGQSGLQIVAGDGEVLACAPAPKLAASAMAAHTWNCASVPGPRLPVIGRLDSPVMPGTDAARRSPAIVFDDAEDGGGPRRAAVVVDGGARIVLLELRTEDREPRTTGLTWWDVGELTLPEDDVGTGTSPEEPVSVVALAAASREQLLATASDGTVYRWRLGGDGRPATSVFPVREALLTSASAGSSRTWLASCALSSGKLLRLASRWYVSGDGGKTWQPELFL